MPGVVAVYHAGGDDLGLAVVAAVPDDARDVEPARVRHRTRCDSSATSSRPSSPRLAAQAVDAAETRRRRLRPVAVGHEPARRAGARCAAALLRTRFERVLRLLVPGGGRRRPARRRRRRRRGHDGEPASGGRSDGDQRHPRRAGRTAASRVGSRIRRRTRCMPRTPRCSGSNRPSCASCARGSVAASARRRRRTSSTSSTAAAALKLGRPVKWIATRSEDMVSLVHGRDFVMTAKLGVNATTGRSSASTLRSWRRPAPIPASARSCRRSRR